MKKIRIDGVEHQLGDNIMYKGENCLITNICLNDYDMEIVAILKNQKTNNIIEVKCTK